VDSGCLQPPADRQFASERHFSHPGHEPTGVRPARFDDCADWVARVGKPARPLPTPSHLLIQGWWQAVMAERLTSRLRLSSSTPGWKAGPTLRKAFGWLVRGVGSQQTRGGRHLCTHNRVGRLAPMRVPERSRVAREIRAVCSSDAARWRSGRHKGSSVQGPIGGSMAWGPAPGKRVRGDCGLSLCSGRLSPGVQARSSSAGDPPGLLEPRLASQGQRPPIHRVSPVGI
jgi:hypothetical protein